MKSKLSRNTFVQMLVFTILMVMVYALATGKITLVSGKTMVQFPETCIKDGSYLNLVIAGQKAPVCLSDDSVTITFEKKITKVELLGVLIFEQKGIQGVGIYGDHMNLRVQFDPKITSQRKLMNFLFHLLNDPMFYETDPV